MPKHFSTKESASICSIDLTKTEGMSSFWKLVCKQNNKKDKQTSNSNATPKLNSLTLKILKLRGIDLTSLDMSNIGSMNLEKGAVFDPAQIQLIKQNLKNGKFSFDTQLLNGINNNSNDHHKDVKTFELNKTSDSSDKSQKGLIKTSTSKPQFNLKKPKVIAFINNTGAQITKLEKNNAKDKNNLNELTENDIKAKTEELELLIPKKKVRVVYLRKKGLKKRKTSNTSNTEETSSKSFERNDQTGSDNVSLLPKTKFIMNEQPKSINFASISIDNKSNQITICKKNDLFTRSPSQPLNSQYNVNTQLPSNAQRTKFSPGSPKTVKVNKEKVVRPHKNLHTITELSHENTSLVCDLKNNLKTKKEHKSKQENKNDYRKSVPLLNDPDLLIKNHNLIIPGDLSEESLFEANPSAGCDTILQLFSSLSKSHNFHEQNSNFKEIKDHKQQLEFEKNYNSDKKYDETMNMDAARVRSIFTKTTVKNDNQNNCEDNMIRLDNHFSLPSNHALKSHANSELNENKRELVEKVSEAGDKLKMYLVHAIEEINGVNGSKDAVSKHSNNEFQTTSCIKIQSITKINNLEDNISEERIEVTSEKHELDESTSCEGRCCNSKVSCTRESLKNNNNLSHISSKSLKPDEGSDDWNDSDGASKGDSKVNVNLFTLDITHDQCGRSLDQTQKSFKKTTISLPVKSPKQQLSITIQLDNKLITDEHRDTSSQCTSGKSKGTKSSLLLEETFNSNKSQLNSGQREWGDCGECKTDCYDELNFLQCGISHTKLTSLGRGEQFYKIDHSVTKQDTRKTQLFGITSNVNYLNKDQRKVFDKHVLGINNCEKSTDLSDFTVKGQYKRTLPDVKENLCTKNVFGGLPIVFFNNNISYSCANDNLNNESNMGKTRQFHLKNHIGLNSFKDVDILQNNLKNESFYEKNGRDFYKQILPQLFKLHPCNNHLISNDNKENSNDADDLDTKIFDFNPTINQESSDFQKQAEIHSSFQRLNDKRIDKLCKAKYVELDHKNMSKDTNIWFCSVGSNRLIDKLGEGKPNPVNFPLIEDHKKIPIFPQADFKIIDINNKSNSLDMSVSNEANIKPQFAESDQTYIETLLRNLHYKIVNNQSQQQINDQTNLENSVHTETSSVHCKDEKNCLSRAYDLLNNDQKIIGSRTSVQKDSDVGLYDGLHIETSKQTILDETGKVDQCACCRVGCLAVISDCSIDSSVE